MKKVICIAAILCIGAILSGCKASGSKRNMNSQTTVNDVITSQIDAQSQTETAGTSDNTSDVNSVIIDFSGSYDEEDDVNIDVDLTTQSSTVVYSMVFDMMSMPEKYLRKTVKMTGIASSYTDEKTSKTYHACIIKDATACCSQGIEYILDDESQYPEDGESITVIGEFSTYKEGQFQYSTLRSARLVG